MTTQTLRAKFSSPPSIRRNAPQSQAAPEMKEAQHRQKDGVSLGKLALGLGVAVGALAGCAEMAPAETVHQLESPEVVVLSESSFRTLFPSPPCESPFRVLLPSPLSESFLSPSRVSFPSPFRVPV